ncbi:ArsR/SmtB family transcription factor [Streptacidiphilus neutrinimicus]|uniref:ArsR/SmtB family transcription factor n=1 Tax=Streptacidiphilus neutrinimicus TaxID=105420 RepID=UPI0007C8203D|nr:winged helix-turn-helix domain-containing protein [Streptacidiphilus neutrinimicus]
MLRLHFTPDDLLRVRFAPAPSPLLEGVLALTLVRAGSPDPALTRWRHRIEVDLPSPVHGLLELLRPDDGLGPVFLDPPIADADDALALVLTTPRAEVAEELRYVWRGFARRPPRAVALAAGEARAWRELGVSLDTLVHRVLPPWWPRIQAGFAADVAWRSQVLITQGLQAMLASLVPDAGWESGTVLRLPRHGAAVDLRLTGRGLTLVPSLLWRGTPLRAAHPDGSLLMVYPALTPLPLIPPPEAGGGPLAALLGPTRAQVLQLLARPQTTGGLARHLGISAATASDHAKTLRAAGLVATARDGKYARHTCTTLGARLLAGS